MDLNIDIANFASSNKALNQLLILDNAKKLICEIKAENLLKEEKLEQRIEELENEIAKNPEASFNYALEIKDRFLKGEEIIKKRPKYASKYANQILGKKWPEAEEAILKSIKYSYIYTKNVLDERWPELEQKIINKESFEDEEYFEKYVIKYIDLFSSYKHRFYEMEEVLAEKLSIKKLFEYWKYHVPAGKLSETGHNRIVASALSGDGYAKDYVNTLFEQNARFVSYLQSLDVNKNATIQELIDYVATTSIQQNTSRNL